MKRLIFTIQIESQAEKLWQQLWDKESYKKWTNVFCAGSYYEAASLQVGESVHFLTPSGEGMFAIVEEHIPNKKIVFKHLGELSNFQEQINPLWESAIEQYELIENTSDLTLVVTVDTLEMYETHMNLVFPKALDVLKRLVENHV